MSTWTSQVIYNCSYVHFLCLNNILQIHWGSYVHFICLFINDLYPTLFSSPSSAGSCCLSDFALSVIQSGCVSGCGHTAHSDMRYRPPEALAATTTDAGFEGLKSGDVYSLGLILWEVANCCLVQGEGTGRSVNVEKLYPTLSPLKFTFVDCLLYFVQVRTVCTLYRTLTSWTLKPHLLETI